MSNTLITTFILNTFWQRDCGAAVCCVLCDVFCSAPAVIYVLFLGEQHVTLLSVTEHKTTSCAASGSSLILQ